MKINQEYLKGLLEAFQLAKNPTTDINELKVQGYGNEVPDFLFHLQILADQNFIVRENGVGLGYRESSDGLPFWTVVPLRLTASGHDFVDALKNREVWEIIKSNFSEAPIDTLWKVSKELFEAHTKKKINLLLGAGE